MGWLERLRETRRPARRVGALPEEPRETDPSPLVRASPGAAALFEWVERTGGHTVLDVGAGVSEHFDLYGGYARRICFADLVPDPPRGRALLARMAELHAPDDTGYDVVVLWNLLDLIGPGERGPLMQAVTRLAAPGARLFAIVDASEERTTRPEGITFVDERTVAHAPLGPLEPAGPRLLPAEMERLLGPWEVARAFMVRSGHREYVAVRTGRS